MRAAQAQGCRRHPVAAVAGNATRRWCTRTRSANTICGSDPAMHALSPASSTAAGGFGDQDDDGGMAPDPHAAAPAAEAAAASPAGHGEKGANDPAAAAAPAAPAAPATPAAPAATCDATPIEEHPPPDEPPAAGSSARPLLPTMLLTAQLAAAESYTAVQQLLAAHAEALETIHLLAALSRMGFLALDAKQPAGQEERAVASSLRARAIDALEAEGNLTTSMCCHLLLASARLRLPLEQPQLAAVEAALVRGLPIADSVQVGQLQSSFSWLGMQPGSSLASALAQAQAQHQRHESISEVLKPVENAAAITTEEEEEERQPGTEEVR